MENQRNEEILFVGKSERPKPSQEYLVEELENEISAFDDEEKELLDRFIQGEEMTLKQERICDKIIGKWWQEKYGFPFRFRSAREEVLQKKYGLPEHRREAYELQEKLLSAIRANDKETTSEIKKEYYEKYPDQLEGVEVLFGLKNFLQNQKTFSNEKIGDREIKLERLKDLTEYQFLFTHYLIQNAEDKEFLRKFWDTAEEISKKTDTIKELNNLRLGLLSQTAVYKILESLEEQPQLSHPTEDAFHAIDLWLQKDKVPLQVKLGKGVVEPLLLESDNIVFPAVQTNSEQDTNYYNAKYFHDSVQFKSKIKEYGEMIGKNLQGYVMIIPYSKIDFITGEPSQDLVDFFREKLQN